MAILVVDDDPALREALSRILTFEGYQVLAVPTGHDALESVVGAELMVLDLGLPDIDGLEVARRVRSMGHDLPILVLTARGDVGDRWLALMPALMTTWLSRSIWANSSPVFGRCCGARKQMRPHPFFNSATSCWTRSVGG